MTYTQAHTLRSICADLGLVGLPMHTSQIDHNSHYLELVVPPPWDLARYHAARTEYEAWLDDLNTEMEEALNDLMEEEMDRYQTAYDNRPLYSEG